MKTRVFRRVTGALIVALVMALAGPAAAQPSFDDLPIAPDGAVGAILDPLEDLIAQITGPLGAGVGDVPGDNAVRILADDAVGASIALSQITFDTADLVMVGRDDLFADSLSSVAAQGITGAPLLLTATDALDPRVAEEMARLSTSRVLILGSVAAISEDVEAELADIFGSSRVSRAGGPSRVETAAELAAAIAPQSSTAILLRAYPSADGDPSQAYADALAAGPLGSLKEFPALLTPSGSLHPSTEAYLTSAGVTDVVVVGGEAAVSGAVIDQLDALGIDVQRVAGQNRYETAVRIASFMGFTDASATSRLILSEAGSSSLPLWAAGFAAAAHGAVFEAPIILADGPLLPPETLAFIGDGLQSNALRLNNLPLICNSFVDVLACQTAALLMAGQLDEADRLTDGAISTLLGELFAQLDEVLRGIIPGPDGGSPGLVGQLLAIVGVPGSEGCEEGCDATALLTRGLSYQPTEVEQSVMRLVMPDGRWVSASRQAAISTVLADLSRLLPSPVETAVPQQAAALADLLDAVAGLMSVGSGDLPVAELDALLTGAEVLASGDLGGAALPVLADVVTSAAVDVPATSAALVADVAGVLQGVQTFSHSDAMVDAYGEEAAALQSTLERLTS